MFNANISNISAISCHEKMLIINLDTYKTLRNKTYFSIKQQGLYVQIKETLKG